ncbi:MAG TPA: 2Fe-2S iron-sulfur cluster-binding protein [Terriglobales bacterium]|nr:2Fe-2S iron-sulfur cluster-binding protein [Terriglobales bacterium]
MPTLKINGIQVETEKGSTVLDAARFLGIPIPTLCHDDGLAPYGACRLCLVEVSTGIGPNGKARKTLQASCCLPAQDGMEVWTHSSRVEQARRLLLEMYVAVCPQSKRIQDMASAMGVRQCRYERKDETCIQCGLCVRMCEQQMMAGAIGFSGRGLNRSVTRPFDKTSELCRQCGACLYICPVCESRCQGPQAESTLCNGCLNISTVCFQSYDNAMCFLDPCHACEISGPFRTDVEVKQRSKDFTHIVEK